MVAQNKVNSCLTGFLVCVNVIFMLFGLGLMTAGIYLLASQWKDIEPTLMTNVSIGLIGLGLFTIMVAVCGCWGALKKKKWFMRTYVVFVFVMMAVFGGLAYVLFQSEGALEDIKAGNDTGNAEFNSLSNSLRDHFNSVYCKAALEPAGSYSTWTSFVKDTCSAPTTPPLKDSCNASTLTCKVGEESKCAYHYCKTYIAAQLVDHITPVAAGVAAFAGLLLLLIVASCGLCCYNKSKTLEEKYDGKGTFVEFY